MEINQSNILYEMRLREGVPYLFFVESEKGKNSRCTCAELATTVKQVYLIYN